MRPATAAAAAARSASAFTAPPLLTMACHCTGCQRMTGSAFSLSAAFPSDGFTVTQGDPVIGGLHGPSATLLRLRRAGSSRDGVDWLDGAACSTRPASCRSEISESSRPRLQRPDMRHTRYDEIGNDLLLDAAIRPAHRRHHPACPRRRQDGRQRRRRCGRLRAVGHGGRCARAVSADDPAACARCGSRRRGDGRGAAVPRRHLRCGAGVAHDASLDRLAVRRGRDAPGREARRHLHLRARRGGPLLAHRDVLSGARRDRLRTRALDRRGGAVPRTLQRRAGSDPPRLRRRIPRRVLAPARGLSGPQPCEPAFPASRSSATTSSPAVSSASQPTSGLEPGSGASASFTASTLSTSAIGCSSRGSPGAPSESARTSAILSCVHRAGDTYGCKI